MPIPENIIIKDGIVGIFKMAESLEELEKRYIGLFHEVPPVDDFQHDRRKKEWLSVRLLIAELIGTDFSISYSGDGSPQLNHPDYHFISISHSAMYAAVYLHKNKKVGLDIESLNRKFSMIEKKYLSENELEQVNEHPVLRAVFWGAKEAVFKWAGREGVDFRKQIRIENVELDKSNNICAVFNHQSEQTINLQYRIFDGHVLVFTL